MFGLMTKKAHEAILAQKDDEAYRSWDKAKAEAEKVKAEYRALRRDYDTRGDLLAKARAEAADLRPDAEAMRAKRKRDREQKAAKKGAA